MTDLSSLPTKARELIRVVIETPRGFAAKIAYDPEAQTFQYSRSLPVGTTYPYDWGFIPSTLGADGDPLDGLVIHQAATAPGVVIRCELLGAVSVEQREKDGKVLRNDRYILAPHNQDAPSEPISTGGVPEQLRGEIEHFFLAAVLGTDKEINFRGWQDAAEARLSIAKGMQAFRTKTKKTK
jgi:inorganic pyrophosphatase